MKILLLILTMILVPFNVTASNLDFLKGNGAFLQSNSFDNILAWDSTFDFAVVDSGMMYRPEVDQIRVPLVMSYSGQSLKEFKRVVKYCHRMLAAVVWEYGPKNTEGLSPREKRIKAERDLREAKRFCRNYGLPFGIITVAHAKGAANQSGIYFKRLHKYADFVMPCLYSQWWNNNPKRTQYVWETELEASLVPVIPIINLYATSPKLKVHELTAEELYRNYGSLNPTPLTKVFYGLKYLDEEKLNIIRTMGHEIRLERW